MGAVQALFADVDRVAGRQLRIALTLMVAGALAEGLGLLTLLPLLKLASGTAGYALEDWLPAGADPFATVLILFVVLMTLRATLLLARDQRLARLENDYDVSLRLRAAATLAGRGWPFAARIGQAGMQSLLANDVPRSGFAVHQGLSAATALTLLTAQLAVAAILSPAMALGALALLCLGLPWQVALTRRGRSSGADIVESQNDATAAAFTFHAGLKASLAQGSVERFLATYRAALDRLATRLTGFAIAMAQSRARHAVAASLAAAIVIAAGHWLALDLPRLIALLVLFARMSGPAQALQQAWVGLAAYAPSFSAIERRVGMLVDKPLVHAATTPIRWLHLSLDKIELRRDPAFTLGPIDLELRPGEWVALLGSSGAGKTTLIDLIAGLVEPSAGTILVDGRPLDRSRLDGWRAGISYVGQQDVPVEATVAEALGDADEAAIWRVLDLVGLLETVGSHPAGLRFPLDDRGTRLSGGERQRLLIARALLRNPRLLLLDEATAAIDSTAERVLVERVRAAHPEVAVLLIAHRAESAALCDRSLILPQPR